MKRYILIGLLIGLFLFGTAVGMVFYSIIDTSSDKMFQEITFSCIEELYNITLEGYR